VLISLAALSPDDWRAWRNVRLAALAEAPYAFGSTLEEWQGEGDTEKRWRERLANVPLNLIAGIDCAAAGIVSATAVDAGGCSDLISMWVAPFARGRKVGDALVQAVIEWARGQRARCVALDVFASNERAIALYGRHGFTRIATAPKCAACESRMQRLLPD
jgi:ribosomal protein S18 acetylase RimI-like enzyme